MKNSVLAILVISTVISTSLLSGCSSSFWYSQVQGAAYDKCESVKDSDERGRCKKANAVDEDKYKKERSAVKGSS